MQKWTVANMWVISFIVLLFFGSMYSIAQTEVFNATYEIEDLKEASRGYTAMKVQEVKEKNHYVIKKVLCHCAQISFLVLFVATVVYFIRDYMRKFVINTLRGDYDEDGSERKSTKRIVKSSEEQKVTRRINQANQARRVAPSARY